ncbi:MAG: glycosyltransferase [Calditrichaeota bacterium]|nr:MAG: glycosyltransferase [Calditrichota bacterium]MBL1205810.1 glycosyltransferase [Calditrichota bacterium]NOG45638.1 glycosyltransferase [Calditrichota bacterium]
MILELLLILSTLFYVAAVFAVLRLFIKAKNITSGTQPFISVIIAARNEAKRIKPTLDSLSKINYPQEKFEIILVNDNSSDDTAKIINAYLDRQDNWKLINLDREKESLAGKKAALNKAIETAKGEIILTTDADCRVQENWLLEVAAKFDDQTIMVLGHSVIEEKPGFLDKLLRFDNLFSGIMVAAPTLAGVPMSSVGRNLAYRKEAYLQVGGYNKLSQHKSGDDVHLTELFRNELKGKIRFCFATFTITKRPDTFREILFQQIRKNSKLLKKSFGSVLMALILFFYLVFLIVFPLLFQTSISIWILALAMKLILEFITLRVAAQKLGDLKLAPYFPFMQIFYPFYVTVMAILGVFQIYEWKR